MQMLRCIHDTTLLPSDAHHQEQRQVPAEGLRLTMLIIGDHTLELPSGERMRANADTDHKGYVASYHKAVAAYQDQLAEQRKKRAALAAAKKAAADRRRGSLHAVG